MQNLQRANQPKDDPELREAIERLIREPGYRALMLKIKTESERKTQELKSTHRDEFGRAQGWCQALDWVMTLADNTYREAGASRPLRDAAVSERIGG